MKDVLDSLKRGAASGELRRVVVGVVAIVVAVIAVVVALIVWAYAQQGWYPIP